MATWFSSSTFIPPTSFNINNNGASATNTKCNPNPKPFSKGNHTKPIICVSSDIHEKKLERKQIQTRKITLNKKSPKTVSKNLLSLGRDGDEVYGDVCPGCGVFMQDVNPNILGFYQNKKYGNDTKDVVVDDFEDEFERQVGLEDEVEGNLGFEDKVEKNFDWKDRVESEGESEVEDLEGEFESEFEDEDKDEKEEIESDEEGEEDKEKKDGGKIDWNMFEDWDDEGGAEEDLRKELDGFMPAGVGYGNVTEEVLERNKRVRISKAERKRISREQQAMKSAEDEVTVCARCHSLRNYGQVKNQNVENLIPDFDFDRLISTRLMKPTGNSASVVVMVVDCVDFDGSFPKRAAKSLFKALESKKDTKLKLPRLVLVATKVDLLPSQISPTRLDKWVRHRAKDNGAPKISGVYLVSARKDLGVRNLLAYIKGLAGPRGNVWVIGAQNAGKSTLINVFAKKEGTKITKLTEAAVPGTTLGILRIGGILPAKAKLYDTPGLLHPYLMSMRLNREEQKMVEIRKELQPRTFRIKAGQAIHVGALMRLDLTESSVDTIYITVWASSNVSLHLGKIENAEEILAKHAGVRLQPPIGEDRVSELGNWEQREIKVFGVTWDVNSIDIAAAGLGWFSLGLKGEATLKLWIYEGIDIVLREPLVLDRAKYLERPGFLLPKSISEAISNQSKLEAENRKKMEFGSIDSVLELKA